jgi:hypothetical protein
MTSPLDKYNQTNNMRWDVLVDIPVWEKKRIAKWIESLMVRQRAGMFDETIRQYNIGIIESIQTTNRIILEDLDIDPTNSTSLMNSINRLLVNDQEKFVLFLELLVKYVRDSYSSELGYHDSMLPKKNILDKLERMLANGSKWSIVYRSDASAGFSERVDDNLTNAAKALDSTLLNQAWDAAFRPVPDPEHAITKAQAALEQIASAEGLSSATSSVYGTLLGDIRKHKGKSYVSVAQPEFNLSNELKGEKSTEDDMNDQYADWFWKGMNIIQKSNPTRHKSNKTSDIIISPSAAKQAVLVATLLAQLMKSHYIRRSERVSLKKDTLAQVSIATDKIVTEQN